MNKKLLFLPALLTTFLSFDGIQAQTYTPGDSFLFFIAQSGTGATKNVQIDLGNFTTSSFSNFNFSSNALSAVIDITYGAGWYNKNTLSWGLVGSAQSQANGSSFTPFGVTLGATGTYAGTPSLDFSALGNIGAAVDPMYNAGSGSTATQGTLLDSLGANHYYSIYDYSLQSSASSADANGFGYFSGTLSGAITTFVSNSIVFTGAADDGTGSGVALAPVTNGSFNVATNGAIFVSAPAVATGTNVWNANSGNLSTIGITNNQNLVFASSGGSVTNDQVSSLSGITYSNTVSSSYTLSGSNIALGASGIVNNSTNTQTVSNNLTLASAQSFNAASGNLIVSGAITNAGNTLTIAGSKNTTLSGAISGVGGLTTIGAGTTTLSAVSTFSGNTLVSSGTLLIAGYGNTNSAVTIASGAVLNGINAGGAAALGAVTIQNGGALALSNAVTDGKLYVQSLNLASNSLSSFDLKSTNNYSSLNASGNIVLGGALTLAIQGLYNNTNNQGLFQAYTSGAGITGNFSSVNITGSYTGSLSYYSNNNTWQIWSGSGTNSYYAGINLNTGLVTVVPEPSTYALFCLGSLTILAVVIRRRISQA